MSLDSYRGGTFSPSFSNQSGPGAFVSLGSLPRRKSHALPQNYRFPVFHIHDDDDQDDNSSSSSDIQSDILLNNPPLHNSQSSATVPFSSFSSSPPSPPSITRSRSLSRGSSTILLSNGKPLKSSLKSPTTSLSSLEIQTQRSNNHLHLRSRSEPPTPTAQTPKNVHFPETDDALTSIRIFSRSAPDADETEADCEDQFSSSFPFPRFPSCSKFEIDPATSSVIPITNILPHTNVLLESLVFPYASSAGVNPHLTGTVLVRNLAYEKHVAVRFTFDDWQTVSEVTARYVVSLSSLPPIFTLSSSSETTLHQWDRFSFMIRLEDYAHNLESRVLWLAARYRVDSMYSTLSTEVPNLGGEWWDNNRDGNYRVAFRAVPSLPFQLTSSRTRRETAPGPITLSMVATPPRAHHHHTHSSSLTRDGKEKISLQPGSGKLRLPNYAAPLVRPASPVSFIPAQHQHAPPSSSSSAQCPMLQIDVLQTHDYESPSPASSTLSTPSASPEIVPRVIINGHPANYPRPPRTQAHIDDWEWEAPPVQPMPAKGPSVRRSTLSTWVAQLPGFESESDHVVPGLPSMTWSQSSSGLSVLPPGSDGLSGDSLYNAFVTQWCFSQGPAAHGPMTGYDGGILA